MPVNHWMYSHECWPPSIGRIEILQSGSMGICSPRAYKDSFDVAVVMKIVFKGLLHGFRITCQVQTIRVD